MGGVQLIFGQLIGHTHPFCCPSCFRVRDSKVFGLVFAVGSGLPIGKEGPFVVIGGLLASILSQFRIFSNIRKNPSRMVDMLGAASAVGVACNFGAPIGGVMFSIEVTATYFAVRNYWRGFFGAVVGAFLYQLFAIFDSKKRKITALFTTNFDKFPFDFLEITLFAALGLVLGLIGALFVYIHASLFSFHQKVISKHPLAQTHFLLVPLAATFIISAIKFPRMIGPYMGLTQQEAVNHLFS
eukprot:Sdes_comp19346_c2_seq1m10570